MLRNTAAALAMAAAFAASPAWAVYKCQDASGRNIFQDRPCATTGTSGAQIDVRPAAGLAPSAPAATPVPQASATSKAPQTETDRLNAEADRLRKENRLSSLNNLHIAGAYGQVNTARVRCDNELAAVRDKKMLANNNLAGATWEQSLSTEMQAIAARCDTEQRRLQSQVDQLLQEKATLEAALGR